MKSRQITLLVLCLFLNNYKMCPPENFLGMNIKLEEVSLLDLTPTAARMESKCSLDVERNQKRSPGRLVIYRLKQE